MVMIYSFENAKIYYQFHNGQSKSPVILLHGWGRSGKDFENLIKFYPHICFLTIDFPPFGNSSTTPEGWTLYTYAGMLISLCDELNIHDATLVGHSFGGRIAILVSAVNCTLVHKCILIDSAGMKSRHSIAYKVKALNYKARKFLHLKQKYFGSTDYQALSPEMKKTFKSVVNTHLESYAKAIKAKTLIVWGKKDTETPLYMGKKLLRLIPDSTLRLIKDGSHFSFLDCPLEFASIFIDFMEET